jgi:AcrR family transcriptional regulator
MNTKKLDRRTIYTKRALKQSLLELISDRPIGKVSIKAICEQADVNRGTFYKYYSDQYDLLNEIQNELDAETRSAFEHVDPDSASGEDIVIGVIHSIAAHSSFCQILCSDYSDRSFLEKMMNNARHKFVERWSPKIKGADPAQLGRLYTFVANGVTAVIIEWLRTGMKESPEEIAAFVAKVEYHGLSYFLDEG